MIYPEDFKSRCKAAYPVWTELHNALDVGSYTVGRYLDDASDESIGGRYLGDVSDERISAETILAATSLDDLQALARRWAKRNALYAEWQRLYRGQRWGGST